LHKGFCKFENGKIRKCENETPQSGFLSALYGSAGWKPADPGHPGRDAQSGLNDEGIINLKSKLSDVKKGFSFFAKKILLSCCFTAYFIYQKGFLYLDIIKTSFL